MDSFDSPQDTLQQYFDDLLQDTARKPAPALRRVVGETTGDAVDYLEPFAEHRVRVARLLSTRPLPVKAQPAGDKPVVEKTIVEKTVVEKPVVDNTDVAKTSVEAPPVTRQTETKPAAKKQVLDKPVPETLPAEKRALRSAPERELPEVETAPAEPVNEAPVEAATESLAWLENGRPSWAQRQFDVLLFKVSGLTLAVPLVALGQIQPLTDQLTPIFGQADWFMGLLPTPMGKVRTVNTAKFVMPERYDERFLQTARYVISIDGLPWGLAVDSVNQPITLHPEDVKWRSERSKRPWLAGTVKEYMCALLDIPMMGKLLQEADVRR